MSHRTPGGRQGNSGYGHFPQRGNKGNGGAGRFNGGNARFSKFNSNYGGNNQAYVKKPYNNNQGYYSGSNYGRGSFQNSSEGHGHFDSQYQLWMGDLDPSWDENAIKRIWSGFGETPISVKIIRDKFASENYNSGSGNAGYCFVTFSSQKAVSSAVLKNGLQIPGSTRAFKLNWASGSSSYSQEHGKFGNRQNLKPQNDFSIFVGDLGADVTETILFESFNRAYPGQVKQVKIMTDPVTKLTKGFGFVKFTSAHSQQKALNEMNGYQVGSRQIRVGMAAGSSNILANVESNSGREAIPTSSIQILQPQPALTQFTDPHNTTIVIKGLSSKVTQDELYLHAIAFGHIIHCKLSPDLNVGHIKFLLRSQAETALLFLHGSSINSCRIEVNWGHSDQVALSNLNFEPSTSASYHKASRPPKTFGTLGPFHLNFEKMSDQELKSLLSHCVEESEPLPIDQINHEYKMFKQKRDEIIDSALL